VNTIIDDFYSTFAKNVFFNFCHVFKVFLIFFNFNVFASVL